MKTSFTLALAALSLSVAIAAKLAPAADDKVVAMPVAAAAAAPAAAANANEPGLSADMQSKIDGLPKDLVKKIDAAIPTEFAKPAKPRKLLIFMESHGYYHDSIPMAGLALKKMGEKTGAYTATLTDDNVIWTPETLAKYDAVFMDNTVGEHPATAEGKKALLDYVKGGKGFGGTHAAADCNHGWDEYFDLIGGEFGGHPYGNISVKNEDPKSPINAAFGGQGFDIDDEIYTFKMTTAKRKQGYSRDKLHILLSIDMEKSGVKDTTRTDGDYALSWISKYGEGKVFYTGLGHSQRDFVSPQLMKHHLDGIQYILGDLEADATPTSKMNPPPTVVPGPEKDSKKAINNVPK